MKCKNCQTPVSGNYCVNCGQRTDVGRITGSSILSLISEGLFQVNKGLFFTILSIFRRPGHSIREYIEGQRQPYFKPVAFVMLLATIYVILSRWLEIPTFTENLIVGYLLGVEENGNQQEMMEAQPIVNWLTGNLAYSIIVTIPMFSLATFIAFYKQKFNYFEHLILNAYLAGYHALLYTIQLLLQAALGRELEILSAVPLFLSIGYRLWAYLQFFSGKKWWYTVAYTLLAYLLFFFTIGLALFLVAIVIT